MHLINKVYTADHDFEDYTGEPSLEYMLAAIPRSGSTFFSHELWRTGGLGAPLEYPNLSVVGHLIDRLAPDRDIHKYWSALKRARTSPNGVFGYKIFMSNMRDISRTDPELFKKVQPARAIYLTRRDTLAQAVSYAKAIQTGAWFADVEYRRPPTFQEENLKRAELMLESQHRFWEKYFEFTGVEVLRLTYEEVTADTSLAVSRVVDFLNVDLKNVRPINVEKTKLQRDMLSKEWAERYSACKA